MIWISFLVSRQKYDALMKFMFAGEVDLPEYPGKVSTDRQVELTHRTIRRFLIQDLKQSYQGSKFQKTLLNAKWMDTAIALNS